MKPGLYNMVRATDQTGVSGTGRVAQMAIFEDGSAVVRWMTGKDSTVNWSRWQDAIDVHINAHPDTTRLIPVGLDTSSSPELCAHGADILSEECIPCGDLESEQTRSIQSAKTKKDLGTSERWAAVRQTSKRVADTIYDYCAARQLRCEEHNSHGLYFDVWVQGRRFILDASPEDEPREKRYSGLVVIRDETHHHKKPTRVGRVNILSKRAEEVLDTLFGIARA